jgi:endonuclease/exonuclease/phosphatase family metal-dependent hydrolase
MLTQQLNVVTWNCNLSVSWPLRFHGALARARRIADALYNSVNHNNIDIICLQECVVHRDIVVSSFVHHPYVTKVVKSSLIGNNIRFASSGLIILSKYPIALERHRIYKSETYHAEAMMAKAVQYVSVRLPSGVVCHVLNTHLQAWANESTNRIRVSQSRAIKTLIDSMRIPTSEPVVLVGDFNVDVYENHSQMMKIGSILNMHVVMPSMAEFSFDPASNTLVGNDDDSEYVLKATRKGCYDELMSTGVCVCCPRQLLDGCLVSIGHARLLRHEMKVLQTKSPVAFDMQLNSSKSVLTRDVSDHFAVSVSLWFADCNQVSYDDLTSRLSRIEFTRRGISDDGSRFSWKVLVSIISVLLLFFCLALRCVFWVRKRRRRNVS